MNKLNMIASIVEGAIMITEQEAFDDYLLNLKEDDYDFYIKASDKQIKKDFYYHCSMYDDLKHIKSERE